MKHFTLIKTFALAATLGLATTSKAQWSSVGFTSNMVHQAAELNGKLYVATGGAGLQELSGTTWNTLTNFNNSSNTPNKQKTSVVAIDGLLYTGSGDFNTSGEGTIHTYDGTNFALLQNSDFYYNGQYEITDFVEYNNQVYVAGLFDSPTAGSGDDNLAKWNGTDWEGAGPGTNSIGAVKRLLVFQNKLYVITGNKVLFYDGAAWDSIPYLYDSYNHAAVFNGELYLSGSIYTYNGTTPTGAGTIAKWNGSAITLVVNNGSGPYAQVNKLFSDGVNLYATALVTAQGGDAYLVRYDGTAWSNFAFLEEASGGYIPGYPLSDYNHIFKFNNELYVGGRFATINNQAIPSLAKLFGGLGIDQSTDKQVISLYPNPSSAGFTVDLAEHSTNRQLVITSITGQQVSVNELSAASTTVSTDHMQAGTYFYEVIEDGNTIATGKLVIE